MYHQGLIKARLKEKKINKNTVQFTKDAAFGRYML